MDCKEFETLVDSYLSDELLVETNHEVQAHLESCAACRQEMSLHRELKHQLRSAVLSCPDSQMNPAAAVRIGTSLRKAAHRPGFFEWIALPTLRLAGLGAVGVVLIAAAALLYLDIARTGSLVAVNSNPELAVRLFRSWAELARLALGDHENCAIDYRLTEKPISLDEAAIRFGNFNKGLDSVMTSSFENSGRRDVEFLEAHSCVYQGRRFAHIVYRHKGEIVSVLVTDPEMRPEKDLGIQTAIFGAASSTASFFAGEHAVFVVSKLSEVDNASLAAIIAPAVRSHVAKPAA